MLTPPPSWDGAHDEWDAWLTSEVARCEREIAELRKGKPPLGRRRVLAQRPFDRPRNPDQLRPSRNPRISTGRDGVLMRLAIAGLRLWRRAYHEARDAWRFDKLVPFPIGTWWVVQRAGAAVA